MTRISDEILEKAVAAYLPGYPNRDLLRAALEAVADDMVREEREACLAEINDQRVDADETGDESDLAYNTALDHADYAIRARTTKEQT